MNGMLIGRVTTWIRFVRNVGSQFDFTNDDRFLGKHI